LKIIFPLYNKTKIITREAIQTDKVLLTINETCDYLGMGQTKVRALLRDSDWSLKIGNKWYAHKKKLDKWLDEQTQKW